MKIYYLRKIYYYYYICLGVEVEFKLLSERYNRGRHVNLIRESTVIVCAKKTIFWCSTKVIH